MAAPRKRMRRRVTGAIALGFLAVGAVGALFAFNSKPANDRCVARAGSWTTRIASGEADLPAARNSLDARTYTVVAESLMIQIEANALAPNNSDKLSPDTMRRIRLLCTD
jgi:hypothetical protein